MALADIVEVNESDFNNQVIDYSESLPVLTFFWANWSTPSVSLAPVLEDLTEKAGGTFRLAKVNVDENSNLAVRFGIRNVPVIKAFRHRTIVAELAGEHTPLEIQGFISSIEAHPADLVLRKAESLLAMHDWPGAEAAYREVLSTRPDFPPALLGLAKTQLALGNSQQAIELLSNFPASKSFSSAEKLLPLAHALVPMQQPQYDTMSTLDAIFTRSLSLFLKGHYPAAMDGLLEILRNDKKFKDGEVKQVILAIFEILGKDNPLTIEYSQELASVLF